MASGFPRSMLESLRLQWPDGQIIAKSTTDHEIRTRIDSFLTELSGLVRKSELEAVQEGAGRRRCTPPSPGAWAASGVGPSRSGSSAQGRPSPRGPTPSRRQAHPSFRSRPGEDRRSRSGAREVERRPPAGADRQGAANGHRDPQEAGREPAGGEEAEDEGAEAWDQVLREIVHRRSVTRRAVPNVRSPRRPRTPAAGPARARTPPPRAA
jgi:hypothetical protein